MWGTVGRVSISAEMLVEDPVFVFFVLFFFPAQESWVAASHIENLRPALDDLNYDLAGDWEACDFC